MAVYTALSKTEIADIVEDFGLAKVTALSAIAEGSVNSNYCLETQRGRYLLRIDEVKKQGVSKITVLEGGANVAQFPVPMYSAPPGEKK